MNNLKLGESENPPYDEAIRKEIESRFCIKFPESFINIMKKWNGGFFDESYQIKVNEPIQEELKYYLGDGFWGVYSFPGFSKNADAETNLSFLINSGIEWGLPELVIPLQGDGHTWIAFDYRDSVNGQPRVIFIESDDNLYHVLTKNFDEFVSALIPYNEVYDNEGNVIYRL